MYLYSVIMFIDVVTLVESFITLCIDVTSWHYELHYQTCVGMKWYICYKWFNTKLWKHWKRLWSCTHLMWKLVTNETYQGNCELVNQCGLEQFVNQCGLEPFVNQCGLEPFVSQCGYEPNVKLRDHGSFVNCEPMWPRAVCEWWIYEVKDRCVKYELILL